MRKLLIFGLIIFSAGWAIRSTYLMKSVVNKPIGGVLITIGLLLMGISVSRMIKK